MAGEDFIREFEFIMKEIQGSTAWSMDRNRPYDGQPHTCQGKRGKTVVTGLTIRDIADCMVLGLLTAANLRKEYPVWADVYGIINANFDPLAAVLSAMCEIEKMMGIYPNVPKL